MGRTDCGGLLRALFVGCVAQGADVEDQFPTVVGLFVVGLGPAGHAGERDAATDDVAELAVGEVLRLRGAEVGNARIEVAADIGLAGAVRGVADRAAVDVTFTRGIQNVGRGLPRIGFEAGFTRNGEIARGTGDDCFKTGRCGRGGETVQQDARAEIAGDDDYRSEEKQDGFAKIHSTHLCVSVL